MEECNKVVNDNRVPAECYHCHFLTERYEEEFGAYCELLENRVYTAQPTCTMYNWSKKLLEVI